MVGKTNTYQDNYYRTHLTQGEFFSYLSSIHSINSVTDLSNIEFEAHHNNQGHSKYPFSSCVKFTNGDWQPIRSITQICECCGKEYKAKLLNLRYKTKSLCHDCAFTNKHTKIKIDEATGCRYQSTLELAFLKRCSLLGVEVENGPSIPYKDSYGKSHRYIIDFYLPQYKTYIEVKGDNIYTEHDLAKGKIQVKNATARKFAEENGCRFIIMTNYDYKYILNDLVNGRE